MVKRVSKISVLSVIFAAAISILSSHAAAQNGGKAEALRIDINSTDKVLLGRLSNGSEMEYVFSAKAGAKLFIRNANPSAFDFRVFSEEADVETEFESSKTLTLTLPEAGDYFLFVRKKAGGAKRAAFRLTVKLT